MCPGEYIEKSYLIITFLDWGIVPSWLGQKQKQKKSLIKTNEQTNKQNPIENNDKRKTQ